MNTRETLKINIIGKLEVGGIEASALAERFGTPLYVMDRKYIDDILDAFTNTLDTEYGNGLISYASKAFCCKEMYRIALSHGIGADVVSEGELLTALSVGFPSDKITFHGNNKSLSEIETAVKNGVGYIVADAISEIDDISSVCVKLSIKQKIMLRVNPGVEAHTHHYIQTSKIDSKFGFSIADGSAMEAIEKALSSENVVLSGLHCHIGSQIFEKKSFILAVEKMTEFYKVVKEKLGKEFYVLDIGGGFGIFYSAPDPKLSVSDYSDYVKEICSALKSCSIQKGIRPPYLMLEPGRSVVGEAGITIYTIGRVKQIKDVKNYLSIDGGMFENPRYALYQAKYTVMACDKMNEKPQIKYSIAGRCCESGDLIAEDCLLPQMSEGERLVVFSTGAYNYSMASNYNRNPVPPVVMVKDGSAKIIIKGQTLTELINNDL